MSSGRLTRTGWAAESEGPYGPEDDTEVTGMTQREGSTRPLGRDELSTVVQWAEGEGWNPGRADADAFWAQDPGGFWGVDDAQGLAGSASAVAYDDAFGFWGLFIVRPELRGHGIGGAIARDTIGGLRERLRPGAAIGLDGVFARQSYYASLGFAFSHRNLRMRGTGVVSAPSPDVELRPLADLPFDQVVEHDAGCFGVPRPRFLDRWISPPGGLALAAVDGGRIVGSGVVRRAVDGWKIGPLFADSPEVAEALYAALSTHAAGEAIHLDAPENNPDAMALAARHGLVEVFGCARMYLGEPPATPWSRIYCVTSFELG